jgi:DNA-binding transcriptional LysR family regulator
MFETDQGRREMEVGGLLRSNSGEALRLAAIDGLGLALFPEWMAGRDVAAGRLTVYMRGDLVPAKIGAFVAHPPAVLGPSRDNRFDDFGSRETVSPKLSLVLCQPSIAG